MAVSKRNTYSILIIVFAFLFCVSFPFNLIFSNNESLCLLLSLILKLAFIIFSYFYIRKENLPKPRINSLSASALLFLPFYLICGSNILYAYVDKANMFTPVPWIDISASCLYSLISVVAEEIVFRVLLCSYFEEWKGKLFAILLSSLCFGATHLLNINSFASIPYCLAQMGYTFFLGLILSLTYVYTKNIFIPLTIHALFNILNNDISASLFDIQWNANFFIVNISVGAVLAIYGILIYIFYFRKKENRYAS